MCVNDDLMKPCKPDHPDFLDKLSQAKGNELYSFKFQTKSLYKNPAAFPDRCFDDKKNSLFV